MSLTLGDGELTMEWTDITPARRGKINCSPTTFEKRCGQVRLTVTNSHIDYPGKWVAYAFPIFDCTELKATTREEAQAEVIQMVNAWLIEVATELMN